MSEHRQRIEKLRRYPIFKLFNFIELAYLSSFYQQKTFGYKDYLYTQGSVPNEIYLIQEGEFQLTLFLENNEENQIRNKLKQKLARNKSLSKQKNNPIDFQETALYNKLKPAKINEFKVGTVAGMGQFIGVQQIVLNKEKRKYNAKCVSTNNRVIEIKKQHLTKVLNQNAQLMSKLKLQLAERQKITHEAHQKMYFLRTNRDSLVKLLIKQSSRERNITLPTQKLENDSQVKLPLLERKNQTEMRKKQMSMNEKPHIKASNESLLTMDNFDDPRGGSTLFLSQPEVNAQTFMLTELEQFDTEVLKKNKQKLNKLLQLSIDKIHQIQQEKTMGLKTSKSQISNQLSPQKLLPKRKYNGVIDSSMLVKEKQRISLMRKNHNQTKERMQLEEKYLKEWKKNLSQKEREKHSSTAHSKHFMERMLLTALKKAGYHEESIQAQKNTQIAQNQKTSSEVQHLETENSFHDRISLPSETKNIKLQKLASKIKKKRKVFFGHASQILESNPFDECYFKKFN